jgi:predicted O-methyltransferase YrrM
MTEDRWSAVDRYASTLMVQPDEALNAAERAADAAGLPAISVTPSQGKFLHLLARIQGAQRILEIGTLGGYSTIWLARAVPPGGRVVSLEVDARHAEVARANLARAGVAAVVDVRVGPALDTLPRLESERAGPFDLIFIDADKPGTPDYFRWALRLSRVGSVIVVDNVVRDGAIVEATATDPSVLAMRSFHEMLSVEPRVSATLVQTVGSKGYDGFVIALVTGGPPLPDSAA